MDDDTFIAIQHVVAFYHEQFPEDSGDKDVYLVREQPYPGSDRSWYTVYTTPGGAQYLAGEGEWEVRPVSDEDVSAVVVDISARRRTGRHEQQVGVEYPYGRHHTADIINLPPQ